MKGILKDIVLVVVGVVIGVVVMKIIITPQQSEKLLKMEKATGYKISDRKPARKSTIDEDYLILARKLAASPSDYIGKKIKLQCKFWKLSPNWLDDNRVYFPSSDYLGFIIQVPKGPDFFTMFIKKTNGDMLYTLDDGEPITIYGIVKGATKDPWIEVSKVEKGWK